MNCFKDVVLEWEGQDYLVPSDQVMGLIATLESVITLEDLARENPLRAKMARAFSMALQYAGAKDVTQESVYSVFFDATRPIDIQNIISSLMLLMIPPKHLQTTPPKAKPQRKKRATKKKA